MALPLPSVLATARYIEDINSITYPQGIKSPKLELNVNFQKGKFRYTFQIHTIVRFFFSTRFFHSYDRDFLLQFMNICREKPDNLPPLADLGLEPREIPQRASGRDRTRSKRGANKEPVAPLEVSANRWVATSARRNNSDVDHERPEIVDRKLRSLLNKLTMERFDSISDQVVAWANQSEREKDGRTLIQVTELVFENATNGTMFPDMYARLCRKIMEQISPKVQDDSVKDGEGKPFAGGRLFRKYLLNCCRKVSERGWITKETTAAAASKAAEDRVVKEANKNPQGQESELCSDECHAMAKAKRHRLGLICFVGELFMLEMLTERIVHEYIKKLLSNKETEEVEIESVCKLLRLVGSQLDTRKARAHVDVYFSRMRELAEIKNIAPRMVFMLQVSVSCF
jgi:translation initiation factor 4G